MSDRWSGRWEAEATVVDGMVLHPELHDEVLAVVTANHFCDPCRRVVFDAAVQAHRTDPDTRTDPYAAVHRQLLTTGDHGPHDGHRLYEVGPRHVWLHTERTVECAHVLAELSAAWRLRQVIAGAAQSLDAGADAESVRRRIAAVVHVPAGAR